MAMEIVYYHYGCLWRHLCPSDRFPPMNLITEHISQSSRKYCWKWHNQCVRSTHDRHTECNRLHIQTIQYTYRNTINYLTLNVHILWFFFIVYFPQNKETANIHYLRCFRWNIASHLIMWTKMVLANKNVIISHNRSGTLIIISTETNDQWWWHTMNTSKCDELCW
jgi:hypothetical protein